MRPWTLAPSLAALRAQVNTAYPGRSKASDGTIGDAAHAASVSDHNPDAQGIVRALDLTHDPAHGVAAGALAEQLRAARDPRIKYVIANRRIFAGNAGPSPWVWRPYSGSDPHTNHVHISVLPGTRGATDGPWRLTAPTTGGFMDTLTPAQQQALYKKIMEDVLDKADGSTIRDDIGYSMGKVLSAVDPVKLASELLPGLVKALPAGAAISQAQLETALRSVLGSLDAKPS